MYVDDGTDAVDYKIVQLAKRKILSLLKIMIFVITQDYGLASLLIDKVHIVMHHKGSIYRADNIQTLLDQRYLNAQLESKVADIKVLRLLLRMTD